MTYKVKVSKQFKNEYRKIAKSGNTKMLDRIDSLIESARENPSSGIGKPEALKHNLSGLYSRRINQHDRLVYSVEHDTIVLHQCLGHY